MVFTNAFIEFTFSIGLFINAALFIPQWITIIKSKDSREVSFITFFGFWLIQFSTLLHGIIHKDWLLSIGQLVSMVTCGTVVVLIVYYRIKNRNQPESSGSR